MVFLTIVRHGESKMNVEDLVQSRTPGELTEKGHKMAEHLGMSLGEIKFVHAFSSDMWRCHQTALGILKHSNHPAPDLKLTQLLRERDFGEMELKPAKLIKELMLKHGSSGPHLVPLPGGETPGDVEKRCHGFMEEIFQLADALEDEDHIIGVTHGCWILSFLNYLENASDFYELINYPVGAKYQPIKNTAHTRIHIGKAKSHPTKRPLTFVKLQCTQHLEKI